MSSNKSTTDTSSSTTPWAPQASQIQNAFGLANNAFNNASSATLPSNFTAQMTPDQLAIFNQMMTGGSSYLPNAGNSINTTAGMQSSGAGGAEGALTNLGAFNPATANNAGSVLNTAQQYVNGVNIPAEVQNAMQAATEQARDVTLPGIDNSAASTGNTNSSRTGIADGIVQRSLAEQAGNLAGTLENNAWNTGTGLGENIASTNNAQSLGALSSALSGGTTLANGGTIGTTSGISNLDNLFNLAETGATGTQENNQLGLTNELQQYQAGVQAPFTPVNELWNIIGSNNWGSNSTGTSTTTQTPSALSMIGGLMGAGGSLLGSSGVVGGANAGLGSSGVMGLLSNLGPLALL